MSSCAKQRNVTDMINMSTVTFNLSHAIKMFCWCFWVSLDIHGMQLSISLQLYAFQTQTHMKVTQFSPLDMYKDMQLSCNDPLKLKVTCAYAEMVCSHSISPPLSIMILLSQYWKYQHYALIKWMDFTHGDDVVFNPFCYMDYHINHLFLFFKLSMHAATTNAFCIVTLYCFSFPSALSCWISIQNNYIVPQ